MTSADVVGNELLHAEYGPNLTFSPPSTESVYVPGAGLTGPDGADGAVEPPDVELPELLPPDVEPPPAALLPEPAPLRPAAATATFFLPGTAAGGFFPLRPTFPFCAFGDAEGDVSRLSTPNASPPRA